MMVPAYTARDLARDWSEDVRAFVVHGLKPRAGWRGRLQLASAALMPSVVCCLLHRISHWMFCRGFRRCSGAVASLIHTMSGASISPASVLGGGIYLPHPCAVVVQARAGPGLRVYAGANICCSPMRPLDGLPLIGAPILGECVVLGSKGVIRGPVQIGDRVTISFGAVVEQDVPAGASVHQRPLRNYSPVKIPGGGQS
jgi:serine O-acetyltransferase